MKKKILVIVICMLMTIPTTILITPEHILVKAVDEMNDNHGDGVGLNTNLIYNITKNLSLIIKNPEYPKGRSFGSDGEKFAHFLIKDWMDDIGLWTTVEPLSSATSQEFKDFGQKHTFTSDLQDRDATLIVYNTTSGVRQTINDFYIAPRWNDTLMNYFLPDFLYDKDKLTHTFTETNVEIKPRPYIMSNILNWLIINCSTAIITNETIMSGNATALFQYLLDQYQLKYNLSLIDIINNPANATKIPGYQNDYSIGTSPYVFLGENIEFNLKNDTYWDGWDTLFETLLNLTSESEYNMSRLYWFFNTIKDQKQCLEMLLWKLCSPYRFKGFLLYDFNNDTYNMDYNIYYARPTIYINQSLGLSILHDINNTRINYTLNQVWDECIESYNVIGQINGTDTNNYTLIGCLYDGWRNQATADASISIGIMHAIAKYLVDNSITPKMTLRFVAFSGEEAGARGAFSYLHDHAQDNISLVIDLNQLGYRQIEPRQALWVFSNGQQMNSTLRAIINDSGFIERTGNTTDLRTRYTEDAPYISDHTPFFLKGNYNIINFLKENTTFPLYTWRLHHRDGLDHQDGDSMEYYNDEEVNATASLIWNVTKYWTVSPDCHFHTISYEAVNITDGTAPDTLKASITVRSILPSDMVMIKATFYDAISQSPIYSATLNFTTNKAGVQQNITIAMPEDVNEGDYYMTLSLYNSTAKINSQAGLSYSANDTNTSPVFHLNRYHSLGDIRIGTSTADVQNIIRASKFTPTEDAFVHNITAYVYGVTLYPPQPQQTYQCMIYRASDGYLMGSTSQIICGDTCWVTFPFSPWPVLRKNTQYYLSIWGDNNPLIYATSQDIANGYVNGSYTFGTPPSTIDWDEMIALKQYSLFCRYTLDIFPPHINNVAANPHTVGFGYNVTITANVTDNGSGINQVKVRIDEPASREGEVNRTMTHISGDLYQYTYTDTWSVGQYNYSIWTQDNENNTNTSTGYHFHVSADATISIATLKNSYSGTQYINITDPPNPPENLTVVGRGLTWNTYYNASSGENILEAYQGPVNYQEDNDTWTPINNTISQLTSNHPAYVFGYRNGNDQGLFGVYFKSNAQNDWPVAFTYNRSDNPTTNVIRSKLVGVGYLDPQSNWAYQYLQNVQSSQGQTNDNSITYEDVFTGTDVTWRYGNTELKEEITLSNATKTVLQNHPPSQYGLHDASSYLVFITKLDHQNLNIYNASGMLTGNVTISDAGVDFKDVLGQFKCALPLGEAYELNNESMRQKLTYRIVHENGNTYLLSGLKISDLNAMMFPVVIDPTLTVYSTSSDGYISNSGTNYNTVRTASSGTVNSSGTYITIGQNKVANFPATYYIFRGFVFFNTSALPSNAYLDNATLSLYKKDDYSTTDFDITIQNGQPTYPHNPMQSGDYNKNYYSGNGGTRNTSSFTSGYNVIKLDDLRWINKTGTTKLCLRSNRDISGTTPTGNEYVNVYSNEFLGSCPPKLVIVYRNQSKIKNTGSTNIKGYLLIQVQFYNTSQSKWLVDNDTVNETTSRTINSGSQLGLDTIFNGKIKASNLQHGTGTYRVYAAFRDPDGNILKTNDGVELKAWWQFSKT